MWSALAWNNVCLFSDLWWVTSSTDALETYERALTAGGDAEVAYNAACACARLGLADRCAQLLQVWDWIVYLNPGLIWNVIPLCFSKFCYATRRKTCWMGFWRWLQTLASLIVIVLVWLVWVSLLKRWQDEDFDSCTVHHGGQILRKSFRAYCRLQTISDRRHSCTCACRYIWCDQI